MSLTIDQMLTKFESAEVSARQIAEVSGFTPNELKLLDTFWLPAFNEGWLYLSPELITQDMGYAKTSDFYITILRKKYTENIDYKEVDNKHDLVVFYENMNTKDFAMAKHTGGKAKKYYIINGKTLKLMLMECGTKKAREINEYYIKVEQLAITMYRYQSSLQKKIAESKATELAKTQTELKKLDGDINRLHKINIDLLSLKKRTEKKETIYIVSSAEYARQGMFKVGRTSGKMKTRSAGHNNTRVPTDKMISLKEFKVNDATALEATIHSKLFGMRVEGSKEFFMCPYDSLEMIVEIIIQNDSEQNDRVNQLIDLINDMKKKEFTPGEWTRGIPDGVFGPLPTSEMKLVSVGSDAQLTEQASFDMTKATHEQKIEFVARCIDAYRKTMSIDTESQEIITKAKWSNLQPYIQDTLGIPKRMFKASEWRDVAINAARQKNLSLTYRGDVVMK